MKRIKTAVLILCLMSSGFNICADELLDLRSVLDSQKGNQVINVPKGNYVLDLQNGKNAYVFSNLSGVTIEGNGSTIICNRQNQAFQFTSCQNVNFRNFIIDYDPPCTSQGTIVELSNDKKTLTVELHKGYPLEGITLSSKMLMYGKDRELIKNFQDVSSTTYEVLQREPVAKIKFTLDVNLSPDRIPLEIGDFVSFDVKAEGNTQAHTFIITECSHMNFENVTVYDSNCFSFLEYSGNANRYYRCVVTRRLGDPRFEVDRLRAGSADCFHSKFATVGPTVEECKFEYTGDDCIAINGRFYPVYNANPQEKSLCYLTSTSSMSDNYVRAGDELVCVNNDGSIRGKAIVKSVAQIMPSVAERQATFAKLTTVTGADTYVYGVKAYLDTWIDGVDVGDVVYSNGRIGRGFKVLRDTVGGNRSRGILLKSSEGIVDGCVVRNTAMSGIALAPEFYWMEAGCPSNVIIRNNTIENCMYHADMGSSQFAALVCVSQAPNGQFAPAGSLNDISIYNNTITGCPYPAVGLTSIDGVYFADNTIVKGDFDRNHGSNFGVQNNRDLYRVNVVNFSTTIDVNSVQSAWVDDRYQVIVRDGYLRVASNELCDLALNVYDFSGRCVLSGISSDSIYIGALPKGVYILHVTGKGVNHSIKLIL
ncbi:T9SS type A sorting domain-containing protein [Barnesiella viscericola]|uniref:T9SS type A sorting domain-containing protein n=1 Tax=Barnesiella viscericola TaxID=397865 RepID=UPI0023542E33|nr:T9SS type A sorting domain-containing protein [Barnesiella viscericola]